MKYVSFIFFNIAAYAFTLDCKFAESFNLTKDSHNQIIAESPLPPNSFIIGSNVDNPTLFYNSSDGEWNNFLTYYSLSAYLNSTNNLQITPAKSGPHYFSVCSFNSTLDTPIKLKNTQVNTCPLNCNNHGTCTNNSCICKSPYFGEDCSLFYIKIKNGYNKNFEIPAYSLKFFNLLSSKSLFISEKEVIVHIFIHPKDIIPSFFEYYDYSNPIRHFKTENNTEFFSIFCPQATPCRFKLLEKENYIQSSYFVMIVVLICVLSPVFVIIIIVIIVYIKKRRVHERENRFFTSNEIHKYAPITKLKDELENDICSICLNKFIINDELRKISACNHYFHPDCIEEWLKSKAKCPNCNISLG